jgi:membrane protease YdiL (CAAX protease family)
LSVLVLTPFFYWLRVDTIGVTSHTRGWTALTGGEWSYWAHNALSALWLGLVPLLLTRLVLGPIGLGLKAGNRRRGAFWLAVGIPLAALAGWLASGQAEMRAVYPLDRHLTPDLWAFFLHTLFQLLYYAAWEILFRGVLLHGLTPRLGFATANMVQTALSVLAHFGRPFTETVSAIPAGLAFGGIARHSGSVWYVVLIHWVVGMAQDAFILAR